MGSAAQAITLQLSSKHSTEMSKGHFRTRLQPAMVVPTLAAPGAQLTSLAFTNSLVNVSAALYSNNKVDLGFYTKVSQVAVAAKGRDAVGGRTLVHKLAAGATTSHVLVGDILTLLDVVKHGSTVTAVTVDVPSLEVTLQLDNPLIHADTADIVEDAAIAVDRVVRQTESFVLADGNYDLGTLEVELAKKVWATAGTSANLYEAMNLAVQLPAASETLKVATEASSGKALAVTIAGDDAAVQVGATIMSTVADALPVASSVKVTAAPAVVGGVQTLTLDTDIGATLAVGAEVTVSGESGFYADQLAIPEIPSATDKSAGTSSWANALHFEELEAIITEALKDDEAANKLALKQHARSVKPFTFSHDATTNKLAVIIAGATDVLPTSTLFLDLLGFDAAQWPVAPTTAPMAEDAEFGRLGVFRAPNAPAIDMVRSLSFHCPTLTDSTYDVNGHYNGSQLASVPITVPRNVTQVWQAPYAEPIPCNQHGTVIEAVDFYLTDQDNRFVDMQGNHFSATVLLRWPDPGLPALGSAGAQGQMKDVTELWQY